MTRNYWLRLTPSLLVAAAMILATLIAVLAAKSALLLLAAPLFLVLAIMAADALASRLRGQSSRPSSAALILGATFLLASLIVTLRQPSMLPALIPVLGVTAWVAILLRPPSIATTRV
jgi:hypothetical protein